MIIRAQKLVWSLLLLRRDQMLVTCRFVHQHHSNLCKASSAFSPGRKWDQIFCRLVLVGAPRRLYNLTLQSYLTKRLIGSSVGMRILDSCIKRPKFVVHFITIWRNNFFFVKIFFIFKNSLSKFFNFRRHCF